MSKVYRKFIAIFLALIIVMGITPLNGFAGLELPSLSSVFSIEAKAETFGMLSYEIEDGEVTITDCDEAASGKLIIPTTIEDYPVTRIGDGAFRFCGGITSITIPDSVTSIGIGSFFNCSALTSITIPKSVTSIGISAFYNCLSLESITYNAVNATIGGQIFGDSQNTFLNSVKTITIGSSVESIPGNLFIGLGSLESFKYNAINVTVSGPLFGTSSDNKPLCSVSTLIIGNQVESIPDYLFYGLGGFESVTIPDSVTSIGIGSFFNCSALTSINIPENVTSIGAYAFAGCVGLESITIPESITSIGAGAFYDCLSLESITYNAVNATIGGQIFGDSQNTFLNSVKTITIGSSVESIPDYLFYGLGGFESVTIPESVTSIGNCSFSYCSALTSINIPKNVTSIGAYAFSGCSGLESITVDEVNPVYHSSGNCLIETESKALIAGCKSSVIPDDGSVTSIGNSAFYGCTGLTRITIPDSVTSIGDYAFDGCTGLTSMTIGNSVSSIGEGAIICCPRLTNITVDENNPIYHSSGNCLIETESKAMIAGCKNSIIPDDGSVTSIGVGAFFWSNELTSVTIPESVTSIGESAFAGCLGLTDVFYHGTEEQWNQIEIGEANDSILNATIHYLDDESSHEHIFDNGVIIKMPTCKETGTKKYSCTDCDYYYTEPVAKLEHTPTTVTMQPTCTVDGTSYVICSECGEPLSGYTPIPATGHHYDEGVITKEPTCKEEGVKTFTCTCGDSYTEPVAKLEHTPETITIAATCTEDGIEFTICSVCEEKLSEDTVIPATGHHYNDGVITKEATCKEEGVKTFTCTCGDSYTEPVKKLDHIQGEWVTEKEPTENEEGKAVIKCTLCGDVLDEKVLPKLEVVKDETTGIELVYNGESYDNEVDINVVEIFDGRAYSLVNTQTGSSEYIVYDVTMLVNGEESQPNGKVKIKIPLPEGYDPTHTFVYHINTANNAPEKMNAVYENGFMVFETDHFSYYAVVDQTPPPNPTVSAKLKVPSNTEVEYAATVTITAAASGVPEGYYVALYDGKTLLKKGSNTEASYTFSGEFTSAKNITVKIIDNKENVQKDANGNELTGNFEIKVKSGFFAKLIAFFKRLFRVLPKVTVEPK